MTLRELLIERIHFAVDEGSLMREFGLAEDEVAALSDLDLFELYEEVVYSI